MGYASRNNPDRSALILNSAGQPLNQRGPITLKATVDPDTAARIFTDIEKHKNSSASLLLAVTALIVRHYPPVELDGEQRLPLVEFSQAELVDAARFSPFLAHIGVDGVFSIFDGRGGMPDAVTQRIQGSSSGGGGVDPGDGSGGGAGPGEAGRADLSGAQSDAAQATELPGPAPDPA